MTFCRLIDYTLLFCTDKMTAICLCYYFFENVLQLFGYILRSLISLFLAFFEVKKHKRRVRQFFIFFANASKNTSASA